MMSRTYDAKKHALSAYPNEQDKAVELFLDYLGATENDFQYEWNMTAKEYLFGKEQSNDNANG